MEWKRAVRESYPLSLIMIDIDCFKLFNDNYGHDIGDDCLKKVAKNLCATAKRPADFIARYGGEEFVSILPNTSIEKAAEFAELLRSNIENLDISHAFSPICDKVTISLGSATILPTIKKSYDLLIKSADKALYKAKSNGKNRAECIDII